MANTFTNWQDLKSFSISVGGHLILTFFDICSEKHEAIWRPSLRPKDSMSKSNPCKTIVLWYLKFEVFWLNSFEITVFDFWISSHVSFSLCHPVIYDRQLQEFLNIMFMLIFIKHTLSVSITNHEKIAPFIRATACWGRKWIFSFHHEKNLQKWL